MFYISLTLSTIGLIICILYLVDKLDKIEKELSECEEERDNYKERFIRYADQYKEAICKLAEAQCRIGATIMYSKRSIRKIQHTDGAYQKGFRNGVICVSERLEDKLWDEHPIDLVEEYFKNETT